MTKRYERAERIEGQLGPFGQTRLLSAAGGADLSTTAVMVPLPKGISAVDLSPRNFTTATNYYTVAMCPYLTVKKSIDDGATYVDFSEELQDGDSGTVAFSSLSTLANGDFVLVGTPYPIRGLRVDISGANPNATASVMTVKYWNTAGAWANITATDGTASGGATLAQDGDITWTVPTDWKPSKKGQTGKDLYWLRIEVSVALDSDTLVANMYGLAETTAAPQYPSTYALFQIVYRAPDGVAALEILGNADDGLVIVNGYSEVGREIG